MDNFRMFWSIQFDWLCCQRIFKNKKKFKKIYEKGKDRIETFLDIRKLIKNISLLKELMKHSLMTDEIKYHLTHQAKYLISIDGSSSESSISDYSSSSFNYSDDSLDSKKIEIIKIENSKDQDKEISGIKKSLSKN